MNPMTDIDDLLDRAHSLARALDGEAGEIVDDLGDLVRRLLIDLDAATGDLDPESKAYRDLSKNQLRLYARRGRKKVRDAHMRTAEVARQRDALRDVVRRYQSGWQPGVFPDSDRPAWVRHGPTEDEPTLIVSCQRMGDAELAALAALVGDAPSLTTANGENR